MTDPSDRRPFRWGIIGASWFADHIIVPAIISAGHQIHGVYSSDPARGREFAERNTLSRSTADLNELLADDFDAVYISTTNNLHARHAEAAARAGKHVLCEKPMALTTADARRVARTCTAHGVFLAINHGKRQDPVVRRMRAVIAQGEIGRPLMAQVRNAQRLNPALWTWRTGSTALGGGATLDITVHDIDTLRFVLAADVHEVTAFTSRHESTTTQVEDTVAALLRLRREDGEVLASVYDSFVPEGAGTAIDVFGTLGSLRCEGAMRGDSPGRLWHHGPAGIELLADLTPEERRAGFAATISSFAAAAHDSATGELASGLDGARALEIALAMLNSARTGATVVVPPPIDPEGAAA